MKVALIILNLLAVISVFPVMHFVSFLHDNQYTVMYTELDRDRIIDHARVKEAYPEKAENDRIEIPKMFAHRGLQAVWFLGYPCIFGFVLNAVLIGIFWPRNTRDNAG